MNARKIHPASSLAITGVIEFRPNDPYRQIGSARDKSVGELKIVTVRNCRKNLIRLVETAEIRNVKKVQTNSARFHKIDFLKGGGTSLSP